MWPFDLRQKREKRIVDALLFHTELSSYELGKFAEIGPGSLYPTLYRMEGDGRLVSRWGVATPERGGRRPRLYKLGTTTDDHAKG